MATKKTIQQLTAALALAVIAATAHGAFFAPTEAVSNGAPAAGIRLSTWDAYQKEWSIYFVEQRLTDAVNNPAGTIRHSEGAIIELRPVSGALTFDQVPADLGYTVINDLNALGITAPGDVPVDKDGVGQPQLTASGTPVYIQLNVSTVATSVPPPVNHVGPWAGPIDPTDDDLSALDSGGSVGEHTVTLGATGDTVTFTWDIGRWAKGDIFLGLNNHTYKVLDRFGNFKRFVATADLDDPAHGDFEWYNETSGCATNWKTGEMFATNFGDGMPAVNVVTRHPSATGRTLYSPLSRRVSTRIERPDFWSWWGIDSNPESVAFDANMNMYVGHSFGNQDDRPLVGDQTYWSGMGFDTFTDSTYYPMAVDGLPREWSEGGAGFIVDETGAKMKLAEAGSPFASHVERIMDLIGPRMQYEADGVTLKFGPAPPAIAGLPDWPAQLPLTYLANPANGNPYQRLDANDVIVEGLVPSRWSLGKRLHRYNIQADGTYLGSESLTPDRNVFWTFTGRQGTDWMDINATGDVIYYTSEDSFIHRYRVRENPEFPAETIGQLPDLGNGRISVPGSADRRFNGLRILPPGDGTGGFLVASTGAIQRLRADGSWVQSYGISDDIYLWEKAGHYSGANVNGWYSLEVDPGGRTLWAAPTDTGWVYVFDIATGKEVHRFEATKHRPYGHPDGARFVQSMCIMWEYTAAQEICGDNIDNDGDGFVDENCKAIEICSSLSPGDDNGDGLADANDPDCGADEPPVAVNDVFETVQDTQLDVLPAAFNQVLKNDVDPDNNDASNPARHDVLTVAKVATSGVPSTAAGTEIFTTQGGTVTLDEDGTMTYVPPFHFHGLDTFVYNVTDAVEPFDGQNFSNTATVTIIVRPIVAGDVYYTQQGVAIDTDTLAANQQMLFNDPSGGLQVSAAGPFGLTYLNDNPSISFVTANGGNVEVFRTGRFIYTPTPTFAGTDHFRYRGNDDVSDSINDALVVIIVEAASTTVVTTDPDPSVYGSPATVRATVTCGTSQTPSVGTVTFRLGAQVIATDVPVVNGVATTTLPASLVVGDYTVTAEYSGSASVEPLCTGSGDDDPHQVVPKPATVTANPQTKPYGTVFTFSGTEFTTSGFIFDDEVLSATLVSATGSPATATVAGSTYPIVPSDAVGVGLENYTITYINGPLTVTPVPLTITALDRTKVYGDVVTFDNPQLTTDFTVAGLVNGDVITSATLASTGSPATATVPGSTYPITIADAVTTADFNNYVVAYVPGVLTVTPRPLSVTAHDKTKVVDEPMPTLDGVWAGFINGDTVDNIYTTTAVESSPAGQYPITPQPDLDDPVLLNYVLTIVPGTLTVTPKSIDVVAQPVCIADTPYVNFTVTAQNFTPVAGEDIVLRWKDSSGEVVLTQTFIWTNTAAPFTQQVLWPGAVVDGNGVVIDWPGWIFNGTEWVVGDDGFQLTRPTATVEIEVNPTTSLQVSYPPPTPNCEAAPPKTPTIVATGGVFPYDGQSHAATCTVTGANGESLPGVLTYDDFGANAPVNVGTYPATCTFAGNADYVPMTATTVVRITPIPLTITANNETKDYDGQVFPGPYSVSYAGFVNDEDPSDLGGALTFGGAATTAVNPGTYTDGIVPSGYTSTNYTIAYVPGTLRIDPPVLIVTADDKSKAYDGTVYSPFTVTYSGFIGDDDPGDLGGALAFSGAATSAVNVGTYAGGIVPSGYTSSIYTIQYVAGTLDITPVPLVVTADDKSKAYDGTVYSPFTVTYSGFVGGDDAGDLGGALTYSGSATTAVNVGTYTGGIVPAGYTSSNYTISYAPGTLTITPIPVTVKAHDKTIYEGDPLPTLDGVWTGFVAGDSATAVYATTGTSASPAGTYPITPTPNDSPVLSNYIVTIIPGTLTILPRTNPCAATGYVTYSQGGWGSKPSGGNPGALLAANFSTVYPGGVAQIGGTFKLTFTSASAIAAYLPAGGSAKVLTSSTTNPTSSQGVLSAQLLALQLAADFSRAGVLQAGLGNMVMQSGPLAGQTVDAILAMANAVFGGNTSALPAGMSLSGLSSLLESIIMNYHEGADGGLLACGGGPVTPPVCTVIPATPGLALVRRDSTFDGRLEGSIQLMQAVHVTMNSTAAVTGQLLLPGVPQKTFNGGTSVTIENGGDAATPTWHRFMFNSGASLGSLVERTDGIDLPTVAAPPASAGTRTVTLNTPTGSIGNFATLKNLTLNSNVGPIAVPAGTYGTFVANNNTAFVLGVAGATEPAVYNFQTLTLNSGSRLDIVGPVVITVKYSISANGPINASQNPEWLTFRVSNGDFTLNSGVPVYGYLEVPNGRVTVNNGAKLVGGLVADRLTNNSGGLVQLVGSPGRTCDEPPAPLALVVKIDDVVKTYGDQDPALTYQIIDGGPVDPGILSGAISRVSGEPVGEYVIGAGTLAATSDYALTVLPGTLTVLPRPAVVTAGTGTKVYGTTDPALPAVTTSGFLAADLPAITLGQSRQPGENVGTYDTTATAAGAVLSNYTVTYVNGAFTITPEPEPVCEVNKILTMNQSSATAGDYGNVRTFTQDGVTVKAMAFSRIKNSNTWAKAFVGAFGTAGLGVTDSSESGSGTTHTLDNNGRNNYLVFVFSQPVAVTRAYLGYVSGDSDAEFWVGTLPDAFSSTPMFNDAVLASLGNAYSSSGGSSARWATFNSSNVTGNVLVVAAKSSEKNDYFKVAKLDFSSCVTTPPPPPPPPVDPPPSTGSGVCEGGVTKIVLKYIGTSPLNGTVYGQRSAPGTGAKVAAQVSGSSPVLYTFATKEMGGLFDSVASGRLANNLRVFIGNTQVGEAHTSCSVPIYPGMKVGDRFEIVELWSKGGGKILPPQN